MKDTKMIIDVLDEAVNIIEYFMELAERDVTINSHLHTRDSIVAKNSVLQAANNLLKQAEKLK